MNLSWIWSVRCAITMDMEIFAAALIAALVVIGVLWCFGWLLLPFTISKKLDRITNEIIVTNRLLDDIRHQRDVPIGQLIPKEFDIIETEK